MTLADEYKCQFRWRSWAAVLDALPPLSGQAVLDLGCAVGDQAALLAERGASVIGIDGNADLLAVANSRGIANAEFREGDVRRPNLDRPVHGIWSSFTAAYLVDLPEVLANWRAHLQPGGWMALTEVDDLFGHAPLGMKSASLLEDYARDALDQGRYDFHMGKKLVGYLEHAGFKIWRELRIPDRELAFEGPASADVLEAWRRRFDRMKLLREFCGADFAHVRDEFLRCLKHPEHRSLAEVRCCIAIR
jgi:SAM-dependent methyltransferase